MSLLQRVTNRRGIVASVTAQAVGLGLVVAAVVTANGYPTQKVDLNDSGVWSVNQGLHQVTRVIASIDQLDNPVTPAFAQQGQDLRVLQDGRNVVIWNHTTSKAAALDPASSIVSPEVALPPGAEVAAGGALVVVLDVTTGKAWFGPTADVLASDFSTEAKAPISAGANAAVAIGLDGTLAVASSATSQVRLYRWAGGAIQAGPTSSIPSGAVNSVTAVGAGPDFADVNPVVEMADGRVVTPGGHVASVPAADGAVLQLPGPSADSVLVATETALFSVSLGSGDSVPLFKGGTGRPAHPVVVGACGAAAWSDRPLVAQGCGTAAYVGRPAFDGQKVGQLVLRVNHGWVILNDPTNGRTALADDPQHILRWQNVSAGVTTPQNAPGSTQRALDPNAQAQPIKARPDPFFGVRPGATALLRVLANDDNTNNLVLRVDGTSLSPVQPQTNGTVNAINGGTALEFTATSTATGSAHFSYVASDGRAVSPATPVDVKVITDPSVNTEPKLLPGAPLPGSAGQRVLLVPVRGIASFAVLNDWYDPEGDPMTLTCDGADSSVRCAPDGTITVRGFGDSAKTFTIKYNVTDNRPGQQNTGSLQVRLVPIDGAPPIARPDFAVAVLGQPITLKPLANDTGFGADPLTLSLLRPVPGMRDNGDGTLTFTPATVGPVVVFYKATSGSRSAIGAIRVDVVKPDPNALPIASPVDAAVRAGGSVIVDVLANDFDPAGRLLMVTSVTQRRTVGQLSDTVAAQILDGRLLRITALPGFSDSAQLTYTISNGSNTATSTVTVRAIPDNVPYAPPLTQDDAVTVQAGAAISIPVMNNDTDPEGGTLILQPLPTSAVGFRPTGLPSASPSLQSDGTWTAFSNGDLITVVAPRKPGLLLVTYSVLNQHGDSASASLKVTVIDAKADNLPTQPQPLEARMYVGQTVVIPAASTFDRLGFPVELADPSVQPTPSGLGSVQLSATGYSFTAGSAAGIATFPYQVRTQSGVLSPPSTVTVVISDLPPAQAPITVPTVVTARPGRSIDIDVTANDFSPTGQPVTLVSVDPTAGVRKVGGFVRVTIPSGAVAPIRATYTIESQGTQAVGTLTVTPDAKATLLPLVATADTAPPGVDSTVTVPVLANDRNPNGTLADLTVTTAQPATVVVSHDATSVVVRRAENDQFAWYTIHSATDNLVAEGLIFVPGKAKLPQPVVPQPPVALKAGGAPVVIDITRFATSLAGRPLHLVPGHAPGQTGVAATVTDPQHVRLVVASTSGNGLVTLPITDLPVGTQVPDKLIAMINVVVTIERIPPDPVMLTVPVSVTNDATPSAAVGLRQLLNPPDPSAALSFSGLQASNGITAALTGSSLVVSARSGQTPGLYRVTYVVTRAGAVHPGAGVVNVTVTLLPPPQLLPCPAQSFTDTQTVRLDLRLCIAPNYANVNKLSFVAHSPEGSVIGSGPIVTFVHDSIFTGGQATLSFSVTDPARNTETGRWAFNVYGPPGPPTNVQVTAVPQTAGAATVTWTEPAHKGGVTSLSYQVVATPTTVGAKVTTMANSSSSANVTGLSFTSAYSFQVIAISAESSHPAPSAATPPYGPFDVSPTVTSVTATAVDSAATVNWVVLVAGSPLANVIVTPTAESPASLGGALCAAPAVTASVGWSGSVNVPVVNGCGYFFAVDVTNSTGKPGHGVTAVAVYPCGRIFSVPAPAAALAATGAGKTIDVTWDPTAIYAAANGTLGPNGITILVPGAFTPSTQVSGNPGSVQIPVPVYGNYQVSMQIQNLLSPPGTSPATAVTAVGTPDSLSPPTATPGDRVAAVSYQLGNANGLGWKSVVVTAQPGGATAAGSNPPAGGAAGPGSATFSSGSLQNGTTYTFTVTGCNEVNCTTSGASAGTVPFGKPVAPTVSLSTSPGSPTMTVTLGNGNGNGLASTVTLQVNGSVSSTTCPSTWTLQVNSTVGGSCVVNGPWSAGYTVTITLVQSSTGATLSNSYSAALPPQPPTPPSVTVSRGALAVSSGCSCYYVHVQTANFSASVTCSFNSWSGSGGWSNAAYGPNDSHDSRNWYGWSHTWVTVTCTTPSGQTASGTDTNW